MKVLVTGGRNYTDLLAVWGALDALHASQGPITLLIHGGAAGADLLADKWAVHNDVRRRQFKPDWDAYGPAAGPIRNRQMLEEGRPDLVIAFPGGKGTRDCVWQAKELDFTVIQHG